MNAPTTNAFVLAGGASTRMGQDKALISLNGVTLIERALQTLRAARLDPRIVAARPDLARFAPVIADPRAGSGPLSGIEAGLSASESELAVFLPVDLPLLPSALLRFLCARASITGALATLPRILGFVQPLCAVYHRSLLTTVSTALDHGDLKVMRVMRAATADHPDSLDVFDLETVLASTGDFDTWPTVAADAFINCNTPTDLLRVQHHMP